MAYKQDNRILKITTSLGEDEAMITELEGSDALSLPFLFTIKMVTAKPIDDVEKLLGTEVTLEFGAPSDNPAAVADGRRKFRGYFRRLTRTLMTLRDGTEWTAEVVPRIWFLSRAVDSRAFNTMSVKDIIEDRLAAEGISGTRISGGDLATTPLDYCVQYRETTLAFISRLMERRGLFYFHEQGESETKLVITDANADCAAWPFEAVGLDDSEAVGTIWKLDEDFSVRSGKVTTRDFDYDRVEAGENSRPTKIGKPGISSDHEIYEYPGAYPEKMATFGEAGQDSGLGRKLTDVAIEREETHYLLRHGASSLAVLDPGQRLKIEADGLADPEVLIISVKHKALDYSHWTDADWGNRVRQAPFYRNEFTCIPQRVPYRPEERTARPFVHGPQTALVTSKPDSLGRVQVQFPWDRQAENRPWIRVSQGWAGAGFGQMHIPRIDEEVIVEFLEGDPDRPIITGRVYNGKNKVPWKLPDNWTQYGIKTQSVEASGSNELRFEDKGGTEQIYVHAQKDLDSEVENNETRKVGLSGTGDRTTDIKNNETLTVGANKTTTVKANFDETVKGTETRNVTGNVSETFMANEDRKITGNHTETITGNVTQNVTGSLSQTVTAGITVTTPSTINVTGTGGITFTAPGGFTVIAPGGTRTVDLFFKMIGGEQLETFMSDLGFSMTKFESCLGFSFGQATSKLESSQLKMDITDFKLEQDTVDLKQKGILVNNANSKITKAILKIFA